MPRILIVEDDTLLVESLRDMVNRAGFQVAEAVDSGEAALAFVEHSVPDVAILDIDLAGQIDGVETAELLAEFNIPIVYLTGTTDDHTLRRVVQTEASGFVSKPFDFAQLRMAIEIALQCSAREQSAAIQQEALSQIINEVNHAIIMTDSHGYITYMNRHAAKLTGCPAPAALHRHINDVLQAVDTGILPEFPVADVLEKRTPLDLDNLQVRNAKTGDVVTLTAGSAAVPIGDRHHRHAAALILRSDADETLYISETVRLGDYLRNVVGGLLRAYCKEDQIAITVHAGDLELDISLAFPSGMIVNVLVADAIAHAKPELNGEIKVDFNIRNDHMGELSINDGGVGLHPTEPRAYSEALPLVQQMVEEIGASLSVRHDAATIFEITFPLAATATV